MIDRFLCHHLTHIGPPGRIAYMTRTAADKRNRTVSVHLHMTHYDHLQKMSDMETVRRRIEAYIEGYLLLSEQFSYFVLVRSLSYKPPLFKTSNTFSSIVILHSPIKKYFYAVLL